MLGIVALCGGNEFESDSVAFNKAVLRAAKVGKPQAVIVPVAFPDNPRKAGKMGVGALSALGARTEALLIADRATANDPHLAAAIETTNVIYLPDGNPLAAVETLRDTETLRQLTHRWGQGAILAASGAAAMALCELYWDSGLWEAGLGLLKGIAVLPHHAHIAGRFSPERLTQDLPESITLIGLDDSTGILLEGHTASVHGSQSATLYNPRREGAVESQVDDDNLTIEYQDGDSFHFG